MSKKYAIQILMSPGHNDWTYITEDQMTVKAERDYVGFGVIYPVLFDEYWEAEETAQIWRKEDDTSDDYVKVVEYSD